MSSESKESDINTDVAISTANTMRERAGENRLKIWLLLGANRLVLTTVLTAVVFVVFLAAVSFLNPDLKGSDTIETLFSAIIGALITGVTLVVTIGQLVLSQENGPLGDQRARMEDSMDFRDFTEELIGAPSPSNPSAFLGELINVAENRAVKMRNGFSEIDSDQLQWEINQFTDSLIGNSNAVRDQLDNADFGSFDVLSAALDYNYSWKISQIERIANEHSEYLGDAENQLLADLKAALSMFGPAREHIKTLYFEWALVTLSQMILYAAIPSLVVAGVMVTTVGPSTFPGTTLGVGNTAWAISIGFTVTLIPFLLFTSYVLRIVTISKRTLAIEPLILRDSER